MPRFSFALIVLSLLAFGASGCVGMANTGDEWLALQEDYRPSLDSAYPRGSRRDSVHETLRGSDQHTFQQSFDVTSEPPAKTRTTSGNLQFMADLAHQVHGTPVRRVDLFEFFVPWPWHLWGDYVCYDAEDRVVTSYRTLLD